MKLLAALLLLTASAASAQAPKAPAADVIFYNGAILTGVALRSGSPDAGRVQALAVQAGKVTAAGPDAAILKLKDKHTELVDLHGAFAMPGFNDAHTHIASAGQQRLSVDLDGTRSLAEMQERVRNYTSKATPGQWILGGGWDHTKWASNALPTRQDLDSVTAGHPALLYRTDGHIAVANTVALAAAKITASTPSPAGGKIDTDAKGELTGIVREAPALALVEQHIPRPTADVRRKALLLALEDASAHGVTSLQDYSDWDDFLVMESLEREGKLHVRVSEWLTFNDPLETVKAHRASHPQDDPLLHTGMLKGFMDGSLGSRTAAMQYPYSDDPNNSGIPRYEQGKLDQMTAERTAAGFQIGFHAIGDLANIMALKAFAAAESHAQTASASPSAARFRIEHAQVLAPTSPDRFGELHVIASMQPSHLLTDMAWATDRLGPQRAKGSYAWRTLLDHKVVLAFGTDYPVESISPFRGLYAAVTRQNEAGTAAYQPQEKLSIGEAIYAYTQGSAFAENAETRKGLLQPGFLADMVVLDRDITKAAPKDLLHARVLRTVLGGATVYTAPATATSEPAHWRAPDTD